MKDNPRESYHKNLRVTGEIRNDTQLLRTAYDCLYILKKRVGEHHEIDKTWIWNSEELKALDIVIEAIGDCL